MKLVGGLDVSDKATAVCVMSEDGEIEFEAEVESSPAAIARALKPYRRRLSGVGVEATGLGIWLLKELRHLRVPMVCLDARLAHAALGAQRNKTDRNDARGLADIVRRGACHTVHVKSPEAVRMRALLVHRSMLKRKAADLRRLLGMNAKLFGARLSAKAGAIAIKPVSRRADPWFHKAAKPVIGAYDVMMRKFAELDAEVAEQAKRDPVCRLLMTAPGVGPITALAFRAAVDDPHRFASSRAVAAYFGLTPRRFQSGESDRHGRISRWGDREVRTLLYLAAESLLHRSKSASHIRGWGLAVEKRRGVRRARVACARRLAVVLHRMWVTGRPFQDAPAFVPAPRSGAA